jgi:hypothetical protein
MQTYKAEDYRTAWLGLPVSHARFGGGMVIGVVASRPEPLVTVHFASGYKKAFRSSAARAELRSLLGLGSSRPYGSDPVTLLENPARMQKALADAQHRHEWHYRALETDLEERLQRAAGIFQARTRPSVDFSAMAF